MAIPALMLSAIVAVVAERRAGVAFGVIVGALASLSLTRANRAR